LIVFIGEWFQETTGRGDRKDLVVHDSAAKRAAEPSGETANSPMLPTITYHVTDEPDYFYVFVNVGPHRIGELLVDKVDEGRARLGSIHVEKEWKRARPWSERIRTFDFSPHEAVNFQGSGIGSELLSRLRSWCASNCVTEVFGSVTANGLAETPGLLEWYAKRGFATHPPLDECLKGSVALVVWNVPPDRESPA
jgi:hypothetical protein